MAGERADAIPEAAVDAFLRAVENRVFDVAAARRGLAAAAPLLPGGEEAERLWRAAKRFIVEGAGPNSEFLEDLSDATLAYGRAHRTRSVRPDAERAPQEDELEPLSSEDEERHARWEFEQSRLPQGDEVETVARTIQELRLDRVTAREAAEAILAALDARSGADTVKAEATQARRCREWLAYAKLPGILPSDRRLILAAFDREFMPASGADRPEGGQAE